MGHCIGEISFYSNRAHWKIPYFFDIPQEINTVYESPEFLFSDNVWRIYFYPNGYTIRDLQSVGWFGMSVYKENSERRWSDVRVGIIGKNEQDIVNTDAVGASYLRTRLIRRSTVISNKDRMVPGGELHLFMSIADINSAANPVTEIKAKDGFEKLKQDFKEILLNGNISDIIIKVEDEEFKAHRCILAARSPVFLAMMTHQTKEKISGVVEIPDVEPSIFSNFLNFLYTGSVENLSLENVGELYTTADKYQVNDLKEICMDHMKKSVSIDNFCDVFTLSLRHDEKDLKDACIKFFTKKSLAIVLTAKWQMFLCENPTIANELFIKHLKMNK